MAGGYFRSAWLRGNGASERNDSGRSLHVRSLFRADLRHSYRGSHMFDTLTDRFEGVFTRLRSKGKLSEADIDAALREVRLALLEADVNVAVARNMLGRIKERALEAEVQTSLTPGQQVIKIVHEELINTLGSGTAELNKGPKPLTILMVGLQGSGKTTTSGKLAMRLKEQGKKPLLVAA